MKDQHPCSICREPEEAHAVTPFLPSESSSGTPGPVVMGATHPLLLPPVISPSGPSNSTLLPAHSSEIHSRTILSLWTCSSLCQKSVLLLRAPGVPVPGGPRTRKPILPLVWLQGQFSATPEAPPWLCYV